MFFSRLEYVGMEPGSSAARYSEPTTQLQIWPGAGGIGLFSVSTSTVRVAVVSSYSNYLNLERWYISTSRNASKREPWGETFMLWQGQAPAAEEGPSSADFAESYIDRAIVSDLDWRQYTYRSPIPAGYDPETYKINVTPVRFFEDPDGQRHGVTAEPIDVWVQFWHFAGELVQVQWFFAGPIVWSQPIVGQPSGFEVPQTGLLFTLVSPDSIPPVGWSYSGGLRPAPFPG